MTQPRAPNPFQFDLKDAPFLTTLFFLGVFLTFAPAIVLTVLVPRDDFSWTALLTWFAISGFCGCLWALAGVRHPMLFPVAALVQGGASVLMGQKWLGPLSLHATGVSVLGLVILLIIAGGYTCFVTFMVRQSTKAVRLWSEMELAAQIHAHLVPPIAVRTASLDIAGRSKASSTMGGDLAEAIELADGSIEVVLADVSGHGVRSGVVMAMLKALLHSSRGAEPIALSELLARLNRTLCDLAEPGMFATLAVARVRTDGTLTYSSAGHPPLLIRRSIFADTAIERLTEGSLPLGVIRDFEAIEAHGHLGVGDALCLYSDGLVEVTGKSGKQLGFDGFARVVASAAAANATVLLETIFGAVQSASTDKTQLDDQTAIVVMRT